MVVYDIRLSKPVSWLRLIAGAVGGREGRSRNIALTLPALPQTHSHSLPQHLGHTRSLPLLATCKALLIRALSCLISDSRLPQETTEAQRCGYTHSYSPELRDQDLLGTLAPLASFSLPPTPA